MKRLLIALAATLAPAAALAHGPHAPVDPSLHGFAHMVPVLIVVVLALAAALVWRARE